MRCNDFESLIDAYLDGELAGTLRIEFDAHRLRCRHCQQGVSMMEALGNVVAHDSSIPPLSPAFSERVLARLDLRPTPARLWAQRLWLGAAGGLSAAAVLGFALLTWQQPAEGPHPDERAAGPVAVLTIDGPAAALPGGTVVDGMGVTAASPRLDAERDRAEAIRAVVMEKLNDRVWDAYADGAALTSDFVRLANYLNIILPDDLARDSIHLSRINPLMSLLQAIVPTAAAEESDASSGDDVYIL